MRYSRLFGKTVRAAAQDITTAGHRFLYQGGFVRDSRAGRYFFLPLGMRVQDRICRVVEEEMERAGAQKILAPILHPLELWRETNRSESAKFELTKVVDRRGAEFVLGGTAEEMMVDLVRKFEISWRDLPFNIYQFSTKFRDELRVRGGLLRTREFLMKDAYSFHADESDFNRCYEAMRGAYLKIFGRLGLETWVVAADNGYMGGEYCHEFVVEHEAGESDFYVSEDGSLVLHADLAGRPGVCFDRMTRKRGIEVGNIFQLGTHYSTLMQDACFTAKDGTRAPYYMGCYGLGIGRTLAAIAEVHHDERGLVWPEAAAPFEVHLLSLAHDDAVRAQADRLYQKLRGQGVEVLYDDREASAGVKFADADLIGIPNRLLISHKSLEHGTAEYKQRAASEAELIKLDAICEVLLPRLAGKTA